MSIEKKMDLKICIYFTLKCLSTSNRPQIDPQQTQMNKENFGYTIKTSSQVEHYIKNKMFKLF